MWFSPLLQETTVNWWLVGGALLGLAIAWSILKFVFQLTMKLFMLGCMGLLVLAGVVVALTYFSQ